MYRNIQLSASLMCIDWLNAGNQLRILEKSKLDYLHIDIIDGNFAPDFTMGSSIINVFRENSSLPLDYHLMVEEPSRLFSSFKISPGDVYSIHQESSRNFHRDLVSVRRLGAKVGVALSPGTPLEVLEYVIEDADVVLMMMVDPGYKGQVLVPQTLRKIEKLRKLIKAMELDIKISVDGCVNAATIPEMIHAGADILVLGSSGLFSKTHSLEKNLEDVYQAIDLGVNFLVKEQVT